MVKQVEVVAGYGGVEEGLEIWSVEVGTEIEEILADCEDGVVED